MVDPGLVSTGPLSSPPQGPQDLRFPTWDLSIRAMKLKALLSLRRDTGVPGGMERPVWAGGAAEG